MLPLQQLIGMKIESIEPVLDYWQLVFSHACISAYNKLELSHPVADLLGTVVEMISFQKGRKLYVGLSNGCGLTICLEQDQYVGPEAFNVHFASGQIVVG